MSRCLVEVTDFVTSELLEPKTDQAIPSGDGERRDSCDECGGMPEGRSVQQAPLPPKESNLTCFDCDKRGVLILSHPPATCDASQLTFRGRAERAARRLTRNALSFSSMYCMAPVHICFCFFVFLASAKSCLFRMWKKPSSRYRTAVNPPKSTMNFAEMSQWQRPFTPLLNSPFKVLSNFPSSYLSTVFSLRCFGLHSHTTQDDNEKTSATAQSPSVAMGE